MFCDLVGEDTCPAFVFHNDDNDTGKPNFKLLFSPLEGNHLKVSQSFSFLTPLLSLFKRAIIRVILPESVVVSVMQATGRVELEDSLRIGNQLRVQNGLQRVGTIPVFLPVAVSVQTQIPLRAD